MEVFVAGATGVLGHRLVAELDERGHDVVGLARDDAGAATVRDAGGEPARGDLLEPTSIEAAIPDGVGAVVHAATAIPTKTKTTAADWETTDRLRREGTETLTAAAADAGADRYVQQSIVWVARQPDGGHFDVDSETHTDRVTASALDGERIAATAGDEHDLDVVNLRGGWFYSHDGGHTRQFGEGLSNRRLPVVGSGLLGRSDATVSLLHADDAATGFAAAVEGDATGTYHLVDDQPVDLADYFSEFADALDAPSPMRMPGWLAKRFVGADTVRFLTNGFPTSNDRFRRDFDWEPAYPTYREGIDAVVDRWLADGTVERNGGEIEWQG